MSSSWSTAFVLKVSTDPPSTFGTGPHTGSFSPWLWEKMAPFLWRLGSSMIQAPLRAMWDVLCEETSFDSTKKLSVPKSMICSGSDGQSFGSPATNVLTVKLTLAQRVLAAASVFLCFPGGRLGSREGHQCSQ